VIIVSCQREQAPANPNPSPRVNRYLGVCRRCSMAIRAAAPIARGAAPGSVSKSGSSAQVNTATTYRGPSGYVAAPMSLLIAGAVPNLRRPTRPHRTRWRSSGSAAACPSSPQLRTRRRTSPVAPDHADQPRHVPAVVFATSTGSANASRNARRIISAWASGAAEAAADDVQALADGARVKDDVPSCGVSPWCVRGCGLSGSTMPWGRGSG
jgi:hypothetical protein